jgi:hypothetical protein
MTNSAEADGRISMLRAQGFPKIDNAVKPGMVFPSTVMCDDSVMLRLKWAKI